MCFLLTDIEGSTRLWEEHPEQMKDCLGRHDAIVVAEVARNGGALIKSKGEGDSAFAVFGRAADGVACALSLQRTLEAEPWPLPLRVRMALHVGEADLREGDYFGIEVSRAARYRSAGHGGQVVMSQAVLDAAAPALPQGASIRDLGLHRFKDLSRPERVWQLCHADLASEFPLLRSLDARPHNLPVSLTSFVGREREIAAVSSAIAGARLVTLTGPGGSGKTRLATQVAAEVLDDFPDGVWLVELAPLDEPALVVQQAASALGVRDQPGRPLATTLVEHMRPKAALLVLDNCEHLIEACASFTNTLLRASERVKILATSREAMRVEGEARIPIPPLTIPDDPTDLASLGECEAASLFVQRAKLVRREFALTAANAASIAEIARRLDGLPLAIELAAARCDALTPEQIATRLGGRLQLLSRRNAGAPRHRTMESAIDWSYDLLSDAERSLFRRLSVFAGSFTLAAAEAVCADEADDVLDLLASVVDRSLLTVDDSGSEMRYRMLEPLRQYARRKLEEGGTHGESRRHFDWYRAVAAGAYDGPSDGYLAVCAAEHDNLRTALGWGFAQDVREETAQLVEHVGRFWWIHGHWDEGIRWISQALDLEGVSGAVRAGLLYRRSLIFATTGRNEEARAGYTEALEIARACGAERHVSGALHGLGDSAWDADDVAGARAFYEEARRTARANGDAMHSAILTRSLAKIARAEGKGEEALAGLEEALAEIRALGNPYEVGRTLQMLGAEAAGRGDMGRARGLLEESVELLTHAGDRTALPWALLHLAETLRSLGEGSGAGPLLRRAIALGAETGSDEIAARAAEILAAIAG